MPSRCGWDGLHPSTRLYVCVTHRVCVVLGLKARALLCARQALRQLSCVPAQFFYFLCSCFVVLGMRPQDPNSFSFIFLSLSSSSSSSTSSFSSFSLSHPPLSGYGAQCLPQARQVLHHCTRPSNPCFPRDRVSLCSPIWNSGQSSCLSFPKDEITSRDPHAFSETPFLIVLSCFHCGLSIHGISPLAPQFSKPPCF